MCAEVGSYGKAVAPSQIHRTLEVVKDLKTVSVKWTETGRGVGRYQTTHPGSLRKEMGLE